VVKVALVGCGAVSQQYIIPALGQIPDCTVEWFVDPNLAAADEACKQYGHGNAARDYGDIVAKVEAAIVAVPNYLHSKVSIDFLKAGRDVLCEKPIADNSPHAIEMIAASKRSGARLAVNLVRRQFDSYGIARTILERGVLGKIKEIEYEEGHPITWPFKSSNFLRKEFSGGGVLIDVGIHSIDLLIWLFGSDLRLLSYRDDGLAGIESNCEIESLISWNQNEIPCSAKLSYTRNLANKLVVIGDQCSLEVRQSDLTGVYLRIGELCQRIGKTGTRSYASYFTDQIRSFINKTNDKRLAGEDSLHSLQFVEECYANRRNLTYPWENSTPLDVRRVNLPDKKILVVGASGFLGTRLVEKLSLSLNLSVRATVHRPQRAVRLARLPVELFDCDLLDRDQVMKAVAGCDIVINCAKDTSGDSRTQMALYSRGIENLLEAAQKNAVRKLIHLSSAAVHGFKHDSDLIDESCGFKSKRSSTAYVKGKMASEKLVMDHAHQVPVVILRPTLIYGPYSVEWVINIVHRLMHESATLVNGAAVANLVYVDDVVDAILCAIESDKANGKALIINNDQEIISWRDYVMQLSNMCNTPAKTLPNGSLGVLRLKKMLLLCSDSLTACLSVLRSREFAVLLARVPVILVLGSKLVKGQKRAELVTDLTSAKQISLGDPSAALVKYQTMDKSLYEIATCHTVLSAKMARTALQWKPRSMFVEGSRRTLDWVKWAGLCHE